MTKHKLTLFPLTSDIVLPSLALLCMLSSSSDPSWLSNAIALVIGDLGEACPEGYLTFLFDFAGKDSLSPDDRNHIVLSTINHYYKHVDSKDLHESKCKGHPLRNVHQQKQFLCHLYAKKIKTKTLDTKIKVWARRKGSTEWDCGTLPTKELSRYQVKNFILKNFNPEVALRSSID